MSTFFALFSAKLYYLLCLFTYCEARRITPLVISPQEAFPYFRFNLTHGVTSFLSIPNLLDNTLKRALADSECYTPENIDRRVSGSV